MLEQALRETATRGDLLSLASPVEDEKLAASEDGLLIRRHVARERDPRLHQRKIEAVQLRRQGHNLRGVRIRLCPDLRRARSQLGGVPWSGVNNRP